MLGQPDDKIFQNLKVKNEGVGISKLLWRQNVPVFFFFFLPNLDYMFWNSSFGIDKRMSHNFLYGY